MAGFEPVNSVDKAPLNHALGLSAMSRASTLTVPAQYNFRPARSLEICCGFPHHLPNYVS